MRARIFTIPVASAEIGQLSALVVGADLEDDTAPVLLFLHGKGEAGSSLSALPLVCFHQTPPFQAILGCLPGTLVLAPASAAYSELGRLELAGLHDGASQVLV